VSAVVGPGALALALGMSPTAFLPAPEGCLAGEARQADLALHRRYLYDTNGARGVRGYGGPSSSESIVLPGSEHLVVLWHGFMASPEEMRPLAERLHRELGVTAYVPLLPGFGGGHRIADRFELAAWTRGVGDALARAGSCHRSASLVGYSVGGGLLAERLLSTTGEGEQGEPLEVRSLVLLSPYVQTAGWMAPALGTRVRAGFLHFLRSGLRLRRVSLRAVHELSRRRYRDLEALLDEPQVYDQRFSLRAGINMLHLSRRLDRLPRNAASEVPTFLAFTEADRTVSWSRSEAFVRRRFRHLEANVRYEREAGIPHQIVVPAVNPRAEDLFAAIADFVGRHFGSEE